RRHPVTCDLEEHLSLLLSSTAESPRARVEHRRREREVLGLVEVRRRADERGGADVREEVRDLAELRLRQARVELHRERLRRVTVQLEPRLEGCHLVLRPGVDFLVAEVATAEEERERDGIHVVTLL